MKLISYLKSALHRKGHRAYKSRQAKLAFADSLLKGSDKLFFTPFIPLLSLTFFETSTSSFFLQLLIIIIVIIGAVCLRHDALVIIDKLNNKVKRI